MEKTKSIVDNMVETQSKSINNWYESTQKMQKAILGGHAAENSTDLYKDWLNNQMNIFNTSASAIKDTFTGATTETKATTENIMENSPEFFKNWYNTQMGAIKQMMDFNQNTYNSFVNFGKPTSEIQGSFKAMNDTMTNLYQSWMGTLNSTYDNLVKNMPTGVNKDAFTNMFNATTTYNKMQEVFTPWMKAIQTGTFNADTFKTLTDPAKYKEITEKMFENFFQFKTKEMFESYTKQMETFFTNNNTLGKEYMTNMQNFMSQFPTLMNGDMAKLTTVYNQFTEMTNKAMAPYMNMVTAEREKQMAELGLEMTNNSALFMVKQAQMQYLLYTTGQQAMEKTAELIGEKIKNNTEITSTQQLYTEWVKVTEKIYTDLFASEEFSTVKSELLASGLNLKKGFETQFQLTYENVPVVFKKEMDELYKTIYDLKKTVKNLEARIAATTAATTEDEDGKSLKTTTTTTRKK